MVGGLCAAGNDRNLILQYCDLYLVAVMRLEMDGRDGI